MNSHTRTRKHTHAHTHAKCQRFTSTWVYKMQRPWYFSKLASVKFKMGKFLSWAPKRQNVFFSSVHKKQCRLKTVVTQQCIVWDNTQKSDKKSTTELICYIDTAAFATVCSQQFCLRLVGCCEEMQIERLWQMLQISLAKSLQQNPMGGMINNV